MNSPRSLYSSGTRLIGLHLPQQDMDADDLALELRRDCPSDGEFTVVNYFNETEEHYLYKDEASAWLRFYSIEENIWKIKAESASGRDKADYEQNAEQARKSIEEWRKIQAKRLIALSKEKNK